MSDHEKRIDELEKELRIVIDGQGELDLAFNELYQYVKTQKDCLGDTMDDHKKIEKLENRLFLVVKRQIEIESKVTALYEYVKTQKDCLSATIDVLSGLIKSLTK